MASEVKFENGRRAWLYSDKTTKGLEAQFDSKIVSIEGKPVSHSHSSTGTNRSRDMKFLNKEEAYEVDYAKANGIKRKGYDVAKQGAKTTQRPPKNMGTGIRVHDQFEAKDLVKGDTFGDADFGEMVWNGKKWISKEK
jgi:hypothetical protein